MGRVVGIDLGTTNSLIAYMRSGQPAIVPDAQGHRLVPSVVSFQNGAVIVGNPAKPLRIHDPTQTVWSVKRLMGKGYHDVFDELPQLPFVITDVCRDVIRIRVGGRDLTPPEISAAILKALKAQAEAALGEPVTQAVITVPAYFNESQRQATKDAGRIAGLEVLRLLNEPTAAVLAYGMHRQRQGVIAVYDLGGGTFDISILKVTEGVFEVLAIGGDTHLGGDDIDLALTRQLAEGIRAQHRFDPWSEKPCIEALRAAAERAKCRLSAAEEAAVVVELPGGRGRYERCLRRQELEVIAQPIIERTLAPCRQALADAGVAAAQVDEVILVGGATRMPLVQRSVAALFGRRPHSELNPDEVVALGAAVQGDILAGRVTDMVLLDVVPLSLGIETVGGVMEKLILRNTTIPTSVTEQFTTFADGQTGIDIHVLQGERELAKDNRSLGRFLLRGIPPLPAGVPKLAVTFTVDASGLLTVQAREERTGLEQAIEIQPTNGLTDAEVERMIADSIRHAREDIGARQLADAKTEATRMMQATEKVLALPTAPIREGERQAIQEHVRLLREAVAQNDLSLIQARMQLLDRATRPLAEQVMNEALREALVTRHVGDGV